MNFPKQTTGRIIEVAAVSDLTTGRAIYVHSNAASTSTRNLIDIHNQNTLSTGTTALSVRQDAAQDAVFIDQNGNGTALEIDSESTTANVAYIDANPTTNGTALYVTASSQTTGRAALFYSNSASQNTGEIVYISQDNTLAVNRRCLSLKQDSTAEVMDMSKGTTDGGYIDFKATADADTTSAISTLTTSGSTTHHVQVEINGTKAWIAVSTNNPS